MTKRMMTAAGLLAIAIGLSAPASAQSSLVDGEVRKVDAAAEKITLRHGPMKKFDMDDGMTMVFRVKDPAMLKQVKAGDKVKFDADKINGQFTVTRIERAK
ncbi:MAG: copper-binding protein [Pseudolabrys sp.]|nr:copper-binding protein [Pseudolabrys sp.]